MRYRISYDTYGLPIATKEYTLAQIAGLLGLEYAPANADPEDETKEWVKIRKDWGPKIGDRPNATRRLILYALRLARRDPAPVWENREDQLEQLCRKFKAHQPTYWERFLRERYQYAKTRDFFAIDYNEIIWEYYAYDDECDALGADPTATGRVFDAAPQWKELMATINALSKKMKMVETTSPEGAPS